MAGLPLGAIKQSAREIVVAIQAPSPMWID
jgi:hypothetical protein